MGRVRWVRPTLGHGFETVYDNVGGRWLEQRRQGRWTKFDLDGFGRLVDTINGVGVRTRREYDVYGRKTYETQPYTGRQHGSVFSYDGLDRITQVSHTSDGVLAPYAYGSGLDVSITEFTGSSASLVTAQDWVAFGDPSDARLVAVTDGEQQTFLYGYGTIGNLMSVTQPGGKVRTWTYHMPSQSETSDLVQSEEHPESGSTTYAYNGGRLASKTDGRNQTFQYSYDSNDRLTHIDAPGGDHDVQMAYGASDNGTLLENGFAAVWFEFDDANRLHKRRERIWSPASGQLLDVDTRFWYDLWDNLTEMTYPFGRAVQYGHDGEGRIVQVKADGAVVADVEAHHPAGGIARLRYGNGIVATFAYDPRDRMEHWSGGPLSLTYGYDRQGNVTSITSPNAALNQTFGYDKVDRVTQVSGFAATGFTYDALGNRRARTSPSVTYDYDDTATLRLTVVTGDQSLPEVGSYQHDDNGNQIGDPSSTYTHTPFNMVETATVGSTATTYRYDGDQQRKLRLQPGLTELFVHGAGGQLLSEFDEPQDALPRWRRDYVYLGSRSLAALSRPAAAPASDERGALDIPVAGTVPPTFTIGGWAIDLGAPSGTGIDQVRLRAERSDGAVVDLGLATYGGQRNDIASIYGTRFGPSGYGRTVTLPLGTYRLDAEARSTVTGAFGPARSVQISIVSDPRMALDAPAHGSSTGQPFVIGGWALDLGATSGTGVNTVHVWAFPSSGDAIFLGAAPYGGNRGDVAAVYGEAFRYSGYTMSASGLAPGTYQITAYARSTVTGTFSVAQSATITIPVPDVLIGVDAPGEGAWVGPPFHIGGWAIDRAHPTASGVSFLHVYAYPHTGGSGIFLGAPATGGSRPDIGAAFGSRFTPSGFGLNVSNLAPGSYTLVFYPWSTVTNNFRYEAAVTRVIHVY